jgi:hypothetical protein
MSSAIFTSRAPESYDPWPCVDAEGGRWDAEGGVCWPESGPNAGLVHEWSTALRYDPRPEFEPTRDKFPWAVILPPNLRINATARYATREEAEAAWGAPYVVRWEPRDRRRNRLLIALRLSVEGTGRSPSEVARAWLSDLNEVWTLHLDRGHLSDEIAHARKVLTLLATLDQKGT